MPDGAVQRKKECPDPEAPVHADDLTSPTSSILTKDVVEAFGQLAGDFSACMPFALLEARRYFALQQRINPSDSDENAGRKLACEAIARKIVARTPIADQYSLLSKRFTVIESDGDESLPLSALESAVDQHATFFLSSNEAQRCVFALWKGLLVQRQMDDGNIEYQLASRCPVAGEEPTADERTARSSRLALASRASSPTLAPTASPCLGELPSRADPYPARNTASGRVGRPALLERVCAGRGTAP